VLSGNASRRVRDLQVYVGAGKHRLHFTRYHSTRFVNATQHLGVGGNWRHNYQWELAGDGENSVDVYYPTGTKRTFTPFSGSEWRGGELFVAGRMLRG
jgi:hypothetical protein